MSSPHKKSHGGASWLICPYCGQDYIWWVLLKQINQQALMCSECDTVWTAPLGKLNETGRNFEDFMAARGQKADWREVVKLRVASNEPA